MTREDVVCSVHMVWGYALKLFKLKNTTVPEIGFFSKSGIAGKAWYTEHRVEFNEILALENKETFITTIAHELAHLITFQIYPNAKQAHGPEFKSVMEALGYDPRTYHTYDVSSVSARRVKTRYQYICTVCGKEYEIAKPTHTKIQAVGGYTCKCKAPIKFTGKETKFV